MATSAAAGLITVNAVNTAGNLINVPVRPIVANGVVALRPRDPIRIPGASVPTLPLPLDLMSKEVGTTPLHFRVQEIAVTDSGVTVRLSVTDQPITVSGDRCLQRMFPYGAGR